MSVETGEVSYTIKVRKDEDDMLFAEVVELPGAIASGADMSELIEAVAESISLYLSSPDETFHVVATGVVEQRAKFLISA